MPFPIIDVALKIIDKIIPDPKAKAEAQLELLKQQQLGSFKEIDADLQMAQGQMDINKVEAGNANVFVSGWRPALGWVMVAAFAGTVILYPLLQWYSSIKGFPLPPKPEIGELMFLLTGMLGLSGYRSFDKLKGTA